MNTSYVFMCVSALSPRVCVCVCVCEDAGVAVGVGEFRVHQDGGFCTSRSHHFIGPYESAATFNLDWCSL